MCEIDFETHKPSADEQAFKNARAAVKGLETVLDLRFINDQFGAWINIQENNWTDTAMGPVNTGEVSHGVAFIGGQLYEMSPSAYFYRDENPCWSPVVQADNEEIAKVYQAITGKEFPVFKADGSEPEPINRLIGLKQKAGFVFDGGVFFNSSVARFLCNKSTEGLCRELKVSVVQAERIYSEYLRNFPLTKITKPAHSKEGGS